MSDADSSGGELPDGPTDESTDTIGPELFFGLVAPVGTDLDVLVDALTVALNDVNYKRTVVRLSELLDSLEHKTPLRAAPRDARYTDYMDAGDALREATKQRDALAVFAVRKVAEERKRITGSIEQAARRRAYIFRSLKTPEEAQTLRTMYGGGFFQVSAYAPLEARSERLARDIALSYEARPEASHYAAAAMIIERDQNDTPRNPYGQNVRDTFPLADLFVDLTEPRDAVQQAVDRFIQLVFGFEFHTPTRDESGMFHAQSAALRSAELGRQVGAAITTPSGDLVAVGANELPVAGGGQVWSDDVDGGDDPRDWRNARDKNDEMKEANLREVLDLLKRGDYLSAGVH